MAHIHTLNLVLQHHGSKIRSSQVNTRYTQTLVRTLKRMCIGLVA